MISDTYDALYAQFHQAEPHRHVAIRDSQADILSPARGFMAGFDFTMQLQVGCLGGCLFCYVPQGHRLVPPVYKGQNGRDWGYVVANKRHPIARFEAHLKTGTLADKTVYWSGVTDPYAAAPAVTSAVWQTLEASDVMLRPRRLVVQTRFLAGRNAERMAAYVAATPTSDGGPPVVISLSMGTDREDLIAAWERATPRFAQRLESLRSLRARGLYVVATLSPFGFWNDLTGTIQTLQTLGVAYVTILFFKAGTSSANTSAHFLNYLRQKHPLLLDAAWQAKRIAEIVAVLGPERVLIGQVGFASLAAPHTVYAGGV